MSGYSISFSAGSCAIMAIICFVREGNETFISGEINCEGDVSDVITEIMPVILKTQEPVCTWKGFGNIWLETKSNF